MVGLDSIREAAARISSIAKRTPVLTSRLFDEAAGAQCFFKCENFQRGGAFKIRGAANFIFSLSPEELSGGVVAFSSGNHAQAVAMAAAERNAKARIVMPTDAPESKIEATKAYGAQVIFYDRLRDDRESIGRRISDETGAVLVPPFDDERIIAGQGTAALELLEDVPNLDTLIVCIGGGGLIAGCSTAAKEQNNRIRVFGAEPEKANDTFLSLRAGRQVEIPPPDTIADGLRATKPGTVTFPIVQRYVDDIFLVTEQEIADAMEFLRSRMKIVVEPSGAVPAAVALANTLPPSAKRVGLIVSGGNV